MKKWLYFDRGWIRINKIVSIYVCHDDNSIHICCADRSFSCFYPDREQCDMAYKEICQQIGILDTEEEKKVEITIEDYTQVIHRYEEEIKYLKQENVRLHNRICDLSLKSSYSLGS